MKRNFRHIIFLVISITIIISSCKVERDIAREFVQKENNISILLLKDTTLYKLNDKIKRVYGYDKMSYEKQDSLWSAYTIYLDSIDDQKTFNSLYSKLISELEYYGFKVYTMESIKKYELESSEKYIFKITQLELEEDNYTYINEHSFPNDSVVYYKGHDINKYTLNCWFELTPSDTSKIKTKLFYDSFSIEDKLDGIFAKNDSNKVKYKYYISKVNLNDIYNLASHSGAKNASFLYNYFLNKFINEEMPAGFKAEGYYSLERNTGHIIYDDSENNENSFYEIK